MSEIINVQKGSKQTQQQGDFTHNRVLSYFYWYDSANYYALFTPRRLALFAQEAALCMMGISIANKNN